MKHTVHYIDDSTHSQVIEANTAEMAAWQFARQQPRTDTSQITVESHPAVPWRTVEITHYRACDLIDKAAPPDEPEPELVIRQSASREVDYIISGSTESLHILATRLLKAIAGFSTQTGPLASRRLYSVLVIPGDGARKEHFLSFEIDPDVQQYWSRRYGARALGLEYGLCLVLLIILAFAGIGIRTVAEWLW